LYGTYNLSRLPYTLKLWQIGGWSYIQFITYLHNEYLVFAKHFWSNTNVYCQDIALHEK